MGICYLQCGHILDYYHGIYIDLDIYAEYSCHLFESISLDNIHEIFAILKDKDIIFLPNIKICLSLKNILIIICLNSKKIWLG